MFDEGYVIGAMSVDAIPELRETFSFCVFRKVNAVDYVV